jgi:predicted ATPase/class 3 adenylate cyclase
LDDLQVVLLTDVVDSTRLFSVLGDRAMADLWLRHDRMARDLLPAHRGREIDRTDGFLLLFPTVDDAVGYGLAFLQGLLPLGLQARVGVHLGRLLLIENSAADRALGAKPYEVEGIAKPLAARVMSVAQGGQLLLSSAAHEALGGSGEWRVTSVGTWRLKGVPDPVELFDVGRAGSAASVPPDAEKAHRVAWQDGAWVPVRQVPHNLPSERDAFVGRSPDIEALGQLIDEGARIVSVSGPGGVGKTRLVTRYAWSRLGEWPGGAWFCDLVEARSAEDVLTAIAGALGVSLTGGTATMRLGDALTARGRCLLVLDNFEQVVQHAAATVGRLSDGAPDACFVVTSRALLGLPGERPLALSPLLRAEAARLFCRRAETASRTFSPSAEENAAIDALVDLLDHIPLAIELAAARVRLFPPSALLARMGRRFELLAAQGGRTDRHLTLRATLDWSWELLTEAERLALVQLSVFEGGFSLEAAEAVIEVPGAWSADLLGALLDKSLVRRHDDERFGLLVSVQHYAWERLDVLGRRADAEARHGRWAATHGTVEAIGALHRHGGIARRKLLEREQHNLAVACRRAVARADGDVAVPTLLALWALVALRGPVDPFMPLARDVLAIPGLALVEDARVRLALAEAAKTSAGAAGAVAILDASLALLDAPADGAEAGVAAATPVHPVAPSSVAFVRCQTMIRRATFLREGSRFAEADAGYDEAESAGARTHEVLAADLALSRAVLRSQQGRLAEARQLYDEALARSRSLGDRRSEGIALSMLGVVLTQQGAQDAARAAFDAALAVHRDVGNRYYEGVALVNLGNLDLDQGRLDAALANYRTALVRIREMGERRVALMTIGNIAQVALESGDLDTARSHYAEALVGGEAAGDPRLVGFARAGLGQVALRQGWLDEGRQALERAEACFLQLGERVELGKVLVYRGELELAAGNAEAARQALAGAEEHARALGSGETSELGMGIARLRAALAAVGGAGGDSLAGRSPA